MTIRQAAILAAAALLPASAGAQDDSTAPDAAETAVAASDQPERKAFLESCAARKFETTVEMPTVDGGKRGRKVTLCGRVGQSDADWATTLKDAVKKIETDERMRPAVKTQLIAALQVEIAKYDAPAPAAAAVSFAAPVDEAPIADVRSGYSVLPPLPAPPKPAARGSLATAAALPPAKKPRLTIKCAEPGQGGPGVSCTYVERSTLLTIRADEDVAAGYKLRFLRKGDLRDEIALDPMRQGQSLRSKLPARLCTGVLNSRAEIQVVAAAGQVVDRVGPFSLRCGT